MIKTKLSYGMQEAVDTVLQPEQLDTTVAEHIQALLQQDGNAQVSEQIRAALNDPQSIIELRSGEQVQTASAGTPLREILPPDAGELEITVSQPHVGG